MSEVQKREREAMLGPEPAPAPPPDMTVAELTEIYTKEHLHSHATESTRRVAASLVRRHLAPRFGEMSVETLSKADVSKHHAELGAVSRTQANRMIEMLSAVLTWGTNHGHRKATDNPCKGDARSSAGVRRFQEKQRERF